MTKRDASAVTRRLRRREVGTISAVAARSRFRQATRPGLDALAHCSTERVGRVERHGKVPSRWDRPPFFVTGHAACRHCAIDEPRRPPPPPLADGRPVRPGRLRLVEFELIERRRRSGNRSELESRERRVQPVGVELRIVRRRWGLVPAPGRARAPVPAPPLSSSSSSSSGTSSDSGSGSTSSSDSGADSGSSSGGTAGKKFVGNISTNGAIRSDFTTYWNQFTPENEGKWGSVEATQGTFNWAPLDTEYQYTQSHGISSRSTTSSGATTAKLDGGAVVERGDDGGADLDATLCARYPNVKVIDVVNEPPPHTTPPTRTSSAAPAAAGTTGSSTPSSGRARLPERHPDPERLQHHRIPERPRSLRVDREGHQGRGRARSTPSAPKHTTHTLATGTVQGLLDSLASQTGLPVYITEYDINIADDTMPRR